jgi:primosomal protein N' (replication factor Y) (superfamily II helicase)
MKYAQVIALKQIGDFDDGLTYSIPASSESEFSVGSFVQAPFRNRSINGVITEISECMPSDIGKEKIKEVSKLIPDITLSLKQINLARFISSYYRTSMGRALRLFLPKQICKGKLKQPTDTIFKITNIQSAKVPSAAADQSANNQIVSDGIRLKGKKQKEALEIINQGGGVISLSFAKEKGISAATLKALVKNAALTETSESLFKKSDMAEPLKNPDKTLVSEQEAAIGQMRDSEKPVLLHGITGSGKTEIYLRRILDAMVKGRQSVLLVPEIALTPQMINYFKDYLGDRIAVFHSKLSDGQRANEWWKVKTGYAALAIGSRSAIFAPADDLGLIILDEEHEWTYKQESSPYYETHRIAEEMRVLYGAELIFGSATPRAETYYKAMKGEYTYVRLAERIHKSGLPKIEIVDLRDEFKKRNFSIFSLSLQNKIRDRLAKNEQVILFVNQRGLANAVVCRDCGYTEKCPNCDIALKLHRSYNNDTTKQRHDETTTRRNNDTTKSEKLVCHYCNYLKMPNLVCPECRSPYIKNVGVGTQRVEEEAKMLFPGARVTRADSDTTGSAEGFGPIYHDFMAHKYDILVGTQMVAKGLDFSKVSLIGIVLADVGLHIPDFRSSERLFQILTQVAGRCGRRDDPGEVILQTYNPEHPTIRKAANHEYDGFIESELRSRSQLNYPPFNKIIKFTVTGENSDKLAEEIKTEQESLEDIFKTNNLKFRILSAPAMNPKMSNRYYYHVLISAEDPSIIFRHWHPPKGWRTDVDPVHTT